MPKSAFALPVLALILLATTGAQAQTHNHQSHADHMQGNKDVASFQDNGQPSEAGQSAFAAVQEIVQILMSDPQTDWSKVDIPQLRQHLVDMHNVTLYARVEAEPIQHGVRFTVTGEGDVRASIQRMVSAHAATMNGILGFQYEASDAPDGAVMIARASKLDDVRKLSGLGFFGLMTLGAHHQEHHLAIAKGHMPH